MFGYLRFFLAFLVLLSHADIRFYGLNPGVIAVVIFYILAGYVVSRLYEEIIPNTKYKIFYFYKDRLWRIFPLYLYTLTLTMLFLMATSYGNPSFEPLKILANLCIIPLNYYMYVDVTILKDPNWWLIPPAWSLGTELQAYLLLPFVLTCKKVKYAAVSMSLLVYTLANASVLNADYFAYRLIVGVFFIFIVGTSIQKAHSKNSKKLSRFDWHFPTLLWVSVLLLGAVFWITHTLGAAYAKETLTGLLVGIPLIVTLSKNNYKLPFDKHLGALSYGIFLSHFLAMWLLAYGGFKPNPSWGYLTSLTALSLIIASIGVLFVEKNLHKWSFSHKISR